MTDRKNKVLWVLLAAAGVGLVAAVGQMALRAREARQAAARQAEYHARIAWDCDFGPAQPPTTEDVATFGPIFDAFGAALQSERPAAVSALLDGERITAELERRGFFARFGENAEPARETFVAGFDRVGRLVVEETLYRWTNTTIRRVSWNKDRTGALVVATHRLDGKPEPLRMRWWLGSTPDGWKVIDFENVVGGVRLTAHLEAATDTEDLNKFELQAVQIRGAVGAGLAGYADTADQLLSPVRSPKLPASLAGPVALAEAFIRIHRGDPAGGKAKLEQAARINPDLALLNLGRAVARARSGDSDGAIAAANEFAANYGDDLGVLVWHGFALEEQGKSDEAARLYDRALHEDPNSLLALNGLRRTRGLLPELLEHTARTRGPLATYGFLKRASAADGLPFSAAWAEQTEPAGFDFVRDAARAQRVEEMYRDKQGIQAYKKVGPVERTFDQLAGCYVRDGDAAGLKKLIAAHDTLFPHDPWLEFWQGELNVLNGEFETAAAYFRTFSNNPAASPADRYTAAARVVKTWVRARDAAKAKEAVNEIGPEWLPVGVRASALALAGDTAGVERLMAARVQAPGGLTPFYADQDFNRLVAAGTFAELRKKYPR